MQKITDFFHQARGFFLQGQLGWVVLPRPLFKSSRWIFHWSHWSKVLHVWSQNSYRSMFERKGKIPVVAVVIMYDLLGANVQQWKSTCFPWHQHLDPLFLFTCFFPFSQSQSKASLGFQSATIWGPRHRKRCGDEMCWTQSPSWKASEKTTEAMNEGEVGNPPATLLLLLTKMGNKFMIIPFGKAVTARVSVFLVFLYSFPMCFFHLGKSNNLPFSERHSPKNGVLLWTAKESHKSAFG